MPTKKALFLVIMVVFGVVATAHAAEGPDVGVVTEYLPTSARYVLKRADTSTRVIIKIGTVVKTDDEVSLPANGSVTVYLQNGKLQHLQGPGTFRIPKADPLGRWARIFRAMGNVVDVQYRTATSAVTRGGQECEDTTRTLPITIPILQPDARIRAGVRDLALAWTGGCPPYSIKVRGSDNMSTSVGDLAQGQVRFDHLTLAPGKLFIDIDDAYGRRASFSLSVVPNTPVPPEDLARDSSRLGTIAQALWLADQENGAWGLDSFEMLRPLIRGGDPLAGKIADVLLWHGPAGILEANPK